MMALWIIAGVLALAALGCKELRWLFLPIVVVLVLFGLMCERGQAEHDKEMS